MDPISRRTLLGSAAKGGLVLGAGGLIAACGSSTAPSPKSSVTTAAGTPKHGGTLRAGLTGGSSTDTLDPNRLVNTLDLARLTNLYEGLVWVDAKGNTYLRLAEEMTPNANATEWTIRLRKGVTFHNGKPLTADDLMFTIHRIVNPKNAGVAAPLFRGVVASRMRKLDERTVVVPFAKPFSTLPETLAGNISAAVLPVGFDPKKPVGTGPFKYVSFTPGQQSVFARYDGYWNHPLPYLDRLVMTNYEDESSQANGLLSGQTDVINLLSQSTIGAVTGAGKKVVIAPGGGFNPFTMRVDVAPFNDVRVRQAFRFAVNREQMMQTVFGGHGTVGNDVFSIWSSEYDHSIPQRPYDPERAKSLLKAAGHDGLSIPLVTAGIAQGVVNMAQVYAQQAASAGIKVNLRQITVTEYFGPNYLRWVFAQDFFPYLTYFSQVLQSMVPGSTFNETHYDNPRYNKLFSEALATANVAKRNEIAHEMQMIDYDAGSYIIPLFVPVVDGYATNVHGIVTSKTGGSFNDWDFEHMWLS
jgi:peptide/nickel transport system substrate-binding protein